MTQTPEDDKLEQIVEDAAEATAKTDDSMSFDELKNLYEEVKTKAEDNYQLALRSKAEVENMQRRAERDISNARKYALENFVNDLIPVLDSLEQGMAVETAPDAKGMREGVELTMKLFVDAMSKHGVERLDPAGHPFNPEHHEAMSMVESKDVDPDHVMQVFQKGYLLHGRVVRPARVIVARGPSDSIDEKAQVFKHWG